MELRDGAELTDLSNYTIPEHPIVTEEIPVSRNMFHRCPVPPIGTISPDNLDQFYLKSIPQYRVFIGKK